MKRNILLASFILLNIIVSSQSNNKLETKRGQSNEVLKTLQFGYLDLSTSSVDDFYQFATGTWMKNNPVPEEESRWSSFNQLSEENNIVLNKILESAADENAEKNAANELIGDFYQSFMDTSLRNELGIAPATNYYELIDGALNKKDLQNIVVSLQNLGVSNAFGLYVSQDKKNNSIYRVHLYQGGLGLPNKDYYFKEDERSIKIRESYINYMKEMFRVGEIADSNAVANVYKIEESLAKASKSPVELREVEKQYNPMTIAELNTLCPAINWDDFLSGRGIYNEDTVIVGQPEFLQNLNVMFNDIPVEDWKIYFKWNLFRSTSSALTMECKRLNFGFYNTTLRGTKKMKPLWKQGISAVTSSAIGEALGQAFVENNFSQTAKDMVNTMVDNITIVFDERIDALDWMSKETKIKAKQKLASFSRKLGFPDEWEDFSSVLISKDRYYDNKMNCRKFEVAKNINKLGKPIDRKKWSMFPQIVNAYYNPLLNEIVFPAGIMQQPFFSEQYEDAVNYARMGAVIGHELTHGFDDNGAKFSADGRMVNWWTEEDKNKFDAKTQRLVDQYNSFEALDGVFVNGKLTLGENIADLGGLTIAYYAFMKSLEGKEKRVIKGYTPEQRFFIAFAHVWKNTIRDNALEARIKSDPHSPGKYRVNGTLSNMPEFFDAFNVKEGDKMRQNPNKIARIW
jgi:putative endopeptidase